MCPLFPPAMGFGGNRSRRLSLVGRIPEESKGEVIKI